MTIADLAKVLEIAGILHPDYPERMEIFADKLAFDPQGCHVAETGVDAAMVGYVFSHLWTMGLPPLLDHELGAVPDRPDCIHLHDIALLPAARGLGAPRDFLAMAQRLGQARGLRWLSLVAIKGQDQYWHAKGFRPTANTPSLEERLRSYGPGVAYMVKTIA